MLTETHCSYFFLYFLDALMRDILQWSEHNCQARKALIATACLEDHISVPSLPTIICWTYTNPHPWSCAACPLACISPFFLYKTPGVHFVGREVVVKAWATSLAAGAQNKVLPFSFPNRCLLSDWLLLQLVYLSLGTVLANPDRSYAFNVSNCLGTPRNGAVCWGSSQGLPICFLS